MYKPGRYFIAAFFAWFAAAAQNAVFPDSTRTIELHRRFDSIVHLDHAGAKSYVDSLYIHSKRNSTPLASFYYHFDLAYLHFTRHRMEASALHFHRALELAKRHDFQNLAIKCLNWLGNHAYLKNQRNASDSLYRTALDQALQLDDADGIATAYFGLFSLEPEQERMMRYLITIDSIYTTRGTTGPVHANALGHMGKLYLRLENLKMARFYLDKYAGVARQTQYIPGIDDYLSTMGELALKENRPEEARNFYQKLLDESTRRGDSLQRAFSLVQLGELHLKTGEFRNAENSLQTALMLFRPLKDSVNITYTSLLLSQTYSKLGNLSRAEDYLNYARANDQYISQQRYTQLLLESSILLAEKKGDYLTAYNLQNSLDSLIKADIQRQNTEAFMALEQQYNVAQKEKEISLLKSEKALAEQQKRNQRNLLLGGIGLTSLAGILLFVLLRNRQKTNYRLKELDRLKSNFFANISHEFRTPLTLIAAPLEDRLSKIGLNEKDRAEFELMSRNTRRLDQLVTQLLDLSKLESGKYKLQVRNGNPEDFLKTLGEAFKYLANQMSLKYKIKIQPLGDCWFDRDVLEKVITNLLSNALKYTPEEGLILYRANRHSGQLQIVVENSCTALSKKQIGQLFDRFYQVDEYAEGTGIGLALVRELVRLAHGTIEVSQQAGRLRFCILLPVEASCFTTEEKAPPHIQDTAFLPQNHMKWEDNSLEPWGADVDVPHFNEEQAILLIVEDNPDVRAYIREIFKKEYRVLDAEHGKKGLEVAIAQVPDLIISDVMMPVMDGLTMCRLLKKDVRTSHIPVLLLTARAGEESEAEGLDTGADDYLIKPFNSRLLHARVRNLIKSRIKLRKRYSQEIVLRPGDISITSVDEKFLEKVQRILDQRLTEPAFNTMEFSHAVSMSRMQLHRKLKALTGLSTSEFIRSQRLKLAHNLLNTGGVRISEIGYQVGFNDPSYFSKCFKAAYGYSPSEYLSRIQAS